MHSFRAEHDKNFWCTLCNCRSGTSRRDAHVHENAKEHIVAFRQLKAQKQKVAEMKATMEVMEPLFPVIEEMRLYCQDSYWDELPKNRAAVDRMILEALRPNASSRNIKSGLTRAYAAYRKRVQLHLLQLAFAKFVVYKRVPTSSERKEANAVGLAPARLLLDPTMEKFTPRWLVDRCVNWEVPVLVSAWL
eukprot:gb/GEZN01011395.1/.p1 GENE.gb/GEZN01011395.1/~~gb/GEZN01011395.1/.p1  ORF type:complete len:191 (+),score=20.65 gb/GEZN01011395.1/:37-609(+)